MTSVGLAVNRSGLLEMRLGSPWTGLGRNGSGRVWLGCARCTGRWLVHLTTPGCIWPGLAGCVSVWLAWLGVHRPGLLGALANWAGACWSRE